MQIAKAFSYAFEDPRWPQKLGLGAVIAIVPVLNLAWMGYCIAVMRRVIAGRPDLLPEWDDLGQYFMDGLMLILARLIYALPVILLIIIPGGLGVITALVQQRDVQEVLGMVTGGVGILLLCVLVLYAVVLSIVYPAVQINFARQKTFGACFQLGQIFHFVFGNAGDFFLAWLVYIGGTLAVGLVVSAVTFLLSWIPCIGQVVLVLVAALQGVWIGTLYAFLFGQVGREGESLPVATAG
jgi:hypothetical protein